MTVALIVLNALGILAFATSGGLMAVRKGMDAVGIFVLASITAVGGGVARDVLLDVPIAALHTGWWWALIAGSALVVFFFHGAVGRLRRAVSVFDAIGLGLFCTSSTQLALANGLGGFESVLVGVLVGSAGGVLRDLMAGEIPAVLRSDTQLYVIPAAFGCTLIVAGHTFGIDGVVAMLGASALITIIRLLALWRRWRAPAPRVPSPDRS